MSKEIENQKDEKDQKQTTDQKHTSRSIIKKYHEEQFILPNDYHSFQQELSWSDHGEERIKLSWRKLRTNYEEEIVSLDQDLIFSKTNLSACTVLEYCYDYVKNNINRFLINGEYENGIIVNSTYILIPNKFLKQEELLLGLQNNPIKIIVNKKQNNFSELEGSFYEFLIREEIEGEFSNYITILPRVIIPCDESKEIDLTTQKETILNRKIQKFIEYDSLFFCREFFFSNCKYQILQLEKEETFRQLYFIKRYIYALEVKRSFSINGLLKMFKRIYLSHNYIEDIMNKYKTRLIHFMFFYNFRKTNLENQILLLFFNYFNKPTEINYDQLKNGLLQTIYDEKKKFPEIPGEKNFYRNELEKAEKKITDFRKKYYTKSYLLSFAQKRKTFKFSFIFFKPILNFINYVSKTNKEIEENNNNLEIIKEEIQQKQQKMTAMEEKNLKMKQEMDLKITAMEEKNLNMKQEMEQNHLKMKEEMEQKNLNIKQEMEQKNLNIKQEMEQKNLNMKQEMEQKMTIMEQKHEEDKQLFLKMLEILQKSLLPQSNEKKTELNLTTQSNLSDHSNPYNIIQAVIAQVSSTTQSKLSSDNLLETEIPNSSQIISNLITKEDQKENETQIIQNQPQDINDDIASHNISLNINQPLNTQLSPLEIAPIKINETNAIDLSIIEESDSNENLNDDEYEACLKKINDFNIHKKTVSYLLLRNKTYGMAIISLSQTMISLYIISDKSEKLISDIDMTKTNYLNDRLIQVKLITHYVIGLSESHIFIWYTSNSNIKTIIDVPSPIIDCDINTNEDIIVLMVDSCFKASIKDLLVKRELVKFNYESLFTNITVSSIGKFFGICRTLNQAAIILNVLENNERKIECYEFETIITAVAFYEKKEYIFFADHLGNLFEYNPHTENQKNNKSFQMNINMLLCYNDYLIIIFDKEIRLLRIDQEESEIRHSWDETIVHVSLGMSQKLYILLESLSIIELKV